MLKIQHKSKTGPVYDVSIVYNDVYRVHNPGGRALLLPTDEYDVLEEVKNVTSDAVAVRKDMTWNGMAVDYEHNGYYVGVSTGARDAGYALRKVKATLDGKATDVFILEKR